MTTNDEAAAVTGPGLERTAAQRDAFPHPCEAVPGAVRRCLRAAVVRHLELELVSRHRSVTQACAGPAYLSVFVSASWTSR